MTWPAVHARGRGSGGSVVAVLAVCFICVVLLWAATDGRQRTSALLFVLLLGLYIPFLVNCVKPLWLAGLPFLVFWIPGPFGVYTLGPLQALTLVEALVLVAVIPAVVGAGSHGGSLEVLGLGTFPWAGFLVLFSGAALTYVLGSRSGGELVVLRTIVFFPFILGLLVAIVVQDSKGALRLLWVLVVASTLFGIVFFLGSRGVGPFSASAFAAGTGRASLFVSLPYAGILILNPQGAADKFAFAFAVAWFLLLTSATGRRRVAAGAAAVVFATVAVSAQGRTGILACALSVTLLGIWAVRRGSAGRMVALTATGAGLGGILGATVYVALHSRSGAYSARVLNLLSAPQNDVTLVWRFARWREGLVHAMSHPEGLGLFSPPYGQTSTWATHNLWLFAALSFGWLGLAGLVMILVRLGRVFATGTRSPDAGAVGLAVLGLVLLGNLLTISMTEALVWEAHSAVMVWAPLWIAFAGVVRCSNRHSALDYHL